MYDLYSLGWHSFQQLCLTISREILGQTIEAFLDSADAGKDGAFAGTWSSTEGESLSGRFVIQCKFTGKREKTLGTADISEDVEKARKLVQAGRCDCYLLMTNAGLSGVAAEDIESLFKDAGVKHLRLLGSSWICQQIKENKRLRMLVPRIYGLGDLSQILDERAYTQARALLASLREDLAKVVMTNAYRKAAEAMDKHGFVLLIGEPAAGKTTIASLLSMAALDQWGSSTLLLETPEKVVERWNPDEPSQFFWIDDAFGVTQYESSLVRGWNHAFPKIRAMLRGGAKIVMTSRDYIYNHARADLKDSAFPLLHESQVVIDVCELTTPEKQQILYNHIKLGKQDLAFRSAIKPFLISIANHPRFVPETARRLADPIFIKHSTERPLSEYSLLEFTEKREHFLQEVIRGLDIHSRAALALIYMRDGSLEIPVAFTDTEREVVERLGSDPGKCISALNSLNGSLAQRTQAEGEYRWKFKHPTIGDAYSALLVQDPEWLGIYVSGTPIDKLLRQVTCGDVGFEKAIVLPRALFPLVLKKLREDVSTASYKSSHLAKWHVGDRVERFLASRCSKEFLADYIKDHPEILDRASKPGLSLNSVAAVDLAVSLHELGLLPEANRLTFVETVIDYAMEGEDLYAIESDRIQTVFNPKELATFLAQVRTQLIPKLSDVRWNWESNVSDNPEDYMEPLFESFANLKERFANDPKIVEKIEREIQLGRQWVSEKMEDVPRNVRAGRNFGEVESVSDSGMSERSIFDDVDE